MDVNVSEKLNGRRTLLNGLMFKKLSFSFPEHLFRNHFIYFPRGYCVTILLFSLYRSILFESG